MTSSTHLATLLTKTFAALAAVTLFGAAATSQAATYEGVDGLAHEIHDQTHYLGEFAEQRLDGLRASATLRGDVRVICLATERINRQAHRHGNVHAIYGDARALSRRVEIMERHFDLMARDLDCAPPCVRADYAQARQMLAGLCMQAQILEAEACELRDQQRHGHQHHHHHVARPPAPRGPVYAAEPEFAVGVDRPRVGFTVASGGRRGTDFSIRVGGVQLRFDD